MENFLLFFEKRWKIKGWFQLIIIFIVFSITGSLSVKLGKPILQYIGMTESTPWYIFWTLRIVIIMPLYQILLITIGTIFGQFRFFAEFEKKMLHRMSGGKLFKEMAIKK